MLQVLGLPRGQRTGRHAACTPGQRPAACRRHPQPPACSLWALTHTLPALTHAYQCEQVDQWLDISGSLTPGAAFEAACGSVSDFLSLRTFLVGFAPSLADVACWAQLQLTLQWDRLRKGGALPHLARW